MFRAIFFSSLILIAGCSEYRLSTVEEDETDDIIVVTPEVFDPPAIGSHLFLIVDQGNVSSGDELIHIIDEQANIINSFESSDAIDITYDEISGKVIVLREVFGESNPAMTSTTTGDGGGMLGTHFNPNKSEFINNSLVLIGESEKLEYYQPGFGPLISDLLGDWRAAVEIPDFAGFGALESTTGCLWKIHPTNMQQISMVCGLDLVDVTTAGMDNGGNLYFSKPGGMLYILESGETSPSVYQLPGLTGFSKVSAAMCLVTIRGVSATWAAKAAAASSSHASITPPNRLP